MTEVPAALARRGITGATDNVPAGQGVRPPVGAIVDLFGEELRQRLSAHEPASRKAPKPAPRKPAPWQRSLCATNEDELFQAYQRADLGHQGLSFQQALAAPAVRRCLELMAAQR